MEPIARLNAKQREDFVAYLDGELDEAATQRIEQTLGSNPVARHEMEMLARTWEMLDELPHERAPAEFTDRTVATAKIEEVHEDEARQRWSRSSRMLAVFTVWTISLVASAAAGFLATYRWVPNEADRLLDDYPVIRNIDMYLEAGDLEFLNELDNTGLFDEPVAEDQD